MNLLTIFKSEEFNPTNTKNLLRVLYRIHYYPNINCMFLIRFFQECYKLNLKFISVHYKMKLIKKYGMYIGFKSYIGYGNNFPHPTSIVIGDKVVIGKNCTIYQNVTIGKRMGDLDDDTSYPKIEDNVTIFCGAVIIGNIIVGSNSIIGANSVVITNVEPNSIYAGSPARKIGSI